MSDYGAVRGWLLAAAVIYMVVGGAALLLVLASLFVGMAALVANLLAAGFCAGIAVLLMVARSSLRAAVAERNKAVHAAALAGARQ